MVPNTKGVDPSICFNSSSRDLLSLGETGLQTNPVPPYDARLRMFINLAEKQQNVWARPLLPFIVWWRQFLHDLCTLIRPLSRLPAHYCLKVAPVIAEARHAVSRRPGAYASSDGRPRSKRTCGGRGNQCQNNLQQACIRNNQKRPLERRSGVSIRPTLCCQRPLCHNQSSVSLLNNTTTALRESSIHT